MIALARQTGGVGLNEACDYFLLDEDHPTYGHLCGQPATKKVGFGFLWLDVCEEHAQDAECGAASLLASLHDTGYVNYRRSMTGAASEKSPQEVGQRPEESKMNEDVEVYESCAEWAGNSRVRARCARVWLFLHAVRVLAEKAVADAYLWLRKKRGNMNYRIISEAVRNNWLYTPTEEDVLEIQGHPQYAVFNKGFRYRDATFYIEAKPEGGFKLQLLDDSSNDLVLDGQFDVVHETATVDEAVKFWVNTIRLAYLPAPALVN